MLENAVADDAERIACAGIVVFVQRPAQGERAVGEGVTSARHDDIRRSAVGADKRIHRVHRKQAAALMPDGIAGGIARNAEVSASINHRNTAFLRIVGAAEIAEEQVCRSMPEIPEAPMLIVGAHRIAVAVACGSGTARSRNDSGVNLADHVGAVEHLEDAASRA